VYFSNVIYTGIETAATAVWGIITAVSMLVMAVISPILGAISDSANSKKKFWTFFMGLGCLSTGLLFIPNPGDTLLLGVIFVLANIGFTGSLVFYDAFLPHIVTAERMDKTSSAGYAWGYIGGGLLLIVNMVMIMNPGGVLGDTDPNIGYKISFVSVALWWFVFSIPMMRRIKEPVISDTPKKAAAAIKDGFVHLKNTFSHIRKYKELFKFLIAFFFYIDGVGTIIRMATVFASDKQLGLANTLEVATNGLLDISMVMALGLLITQLVAWPMAFVMGRAGNKWGAKNTLYLCIVSYIIIATLGTFMFADWNFLILAALVGTVQGGVQALSRSLFAVMVPKEKTGEFFGFFGIFEKFASILGPLLMSLVTMITSNVRLSVLAVIPLFVVGMLLLIKVKTPDTRLKEENATQNTAINL